jgi:hypothetical protein
VVLAGLFVAVALVPRVVVLHDDARTILSVQGDDVRPWPLPAGVAREGAVPVPASAFDELDSRTAPWLEDAWQFDPCPELEDPRAEGGTSWRPVERLLVEPPPRPPRRRAAVDTTTPGFRVETSGAALAVPLVVGEETLVFVLAKTGYGATNAPTLSVPAQIDVSPALRGSFPELYAALFAHAARTHPGVVVREVSQYAGASRETLAAFGYSGADALYVTRLHVTPGVGQLELGPTKETTSPTTYRVVHPWAAPVRCANPEDTGASTNPPVPVAPLPDSPPPAQSDLLRIDVPSLGLRAGPWWARVAPFDWGGLLGASLGLGAVIAGRRRRA